MYQKPSISVKLNHWVVFGAKMIPPGHLIDLVPINLVPRVPEYVLKISLHIYPQLSPIKCAYLNMTSPGM